MAPPASTNRTWRWFITGVVATILVVAGALALSQYRSSSGPRRVGVGSLSQGWGWEIDGRPAHRLATFSFRIENANRFAVEIRDVGSDIAGLRLVHLDPWSRPLHIGAKGSVVVAVTYRALSCAMSSTPPQPISLQVRAFGAAWRVAELRLVAGHGPSSWREWVRDAACHTKVHLHGTSYGTSVQTFSSSAVTTSTSYAGGS